MEFKAKRRKLKVTVDEKIFEVRFPKLGELDIYREQAKDSKSDAGSTLSDFLESLGLPKDAQKELEVGDLSEIVNLLTDQKKT